MTSSNFQLGIAPAEAQSAVIFIHGRGSSGHDMSGLAQSIPTNNVAWFAPSAPAGAWYPQRFFVPTEQNEPYLSEALQNVDQSFAHLKSAGIPSERIGLVGFSQGACLALEYAARNPRRYGFVAALSGGLIGPLDTPRSRIDLLQTPVLLGCADHDAHIPFEFVESSRKFFNGANAAVTFQRFSGSAHTVFPEEIEWIRKALAAMSAGEVG